MSDKDQNLEVFKQVLQNGPVLDFTGLDGAPAEPVLKNQTEIKDLRTKAQPKVADPIEDVEDELEQDSTQIDDEPTPTDLGDASDILTIVAHFADKGILSGYDPEAMKELDDEQAFENVITTTVEARVQEYKESIPEEARYFLEYLEQGGDPREYTNMMSRPDYTKMVIEDNESNQKRVVRDFLLLNDYTPEQVERKIERYIDKGTLEEEAEDALGRLAKAQVKEKELLLKSQAEQAKATEQQYAKYLEDLNSNIKTKKDLAGFELKEEQKKKLFEHLTKPVTKDGKTQFIINFEKDPDAMLKAAYFDMIGWDFSKLAVKAETKATKSLKEKLKSKDTMSRMGGSSESTKDDTFSAFKSLVKS